MMIAFDVPRYLQISKKKKIALNLNWYRNAHFTESNRAKKMFTALMKEELLGLRFERPIHIELSIGAKDKRKFDLDNVGAITLKFLQDALTFYGCIPEDNYEVVKSVKSQFGGINRDKIPTTFVMITEEE